MGACFSSACSEEEASLGEQEGDEAVVYVGQGDELSPDLKGRRIIVSLCSRQGKKGLNQDAAILCKVCGFLQRKKILGTKFCWSAERNSLEIIKFLSIGD